MQQPPGGKSWANHHIWWLGPNSVASQTNGGKREYHLDKFGGKFAKIIIHCSAKEMGVNYKNEMILHESTPSGGDWHVVVQWHERSIVAMGNVCTASPGRCMLRWNYLLLRSLRPK